jgi:DNA-binding NarL/FixJ family response regulator
MLERTELSNREILILEALAQGASGAELSRAIGQSRGTAEAQIRVLFKKLGARSRHHLVAQAFRLGILQI